MVAESISYFADSSSSMPEMRNWTSFLKGRLLKPCLVACAMNSSLMLKMRAWTSSSAVMPGNFCLRVRAYWASRSGRAWRAIAWR